jgi:hypothetical protein
MPYWTHYWTNKTVVQESRNGDVEMRHTADNAFRQHGVTPGDVVYIVTNIKGTIYLIGSMVVDQVADESRARQVIGPEVWGVSDHLLAKKPFSRCRFDVTVPFGELRQIEFVGPKGSNALKFDQRAGADPRAVDRQTLRGVREITESTAGLFNRLLA